MAVNSLLGYVIEKKLTISCSTDIAEKMAATDLDHVELPVRFCSYSLW